MNRRRALRITALGGVSLALGGPLTRALLREAGLTRVSETRSLLGTLVSLTGVHGHRDQARALVAAGFGEMERLQALLSRHDPTTPMARLNREGVLEPMPPELRTVLRRARHWHQLTGGAFDPTVAPLLTLYESAHERGLGVPTDAELTNIRAQVGFHLLDLHETRVSFAREGVRLTLDGIAKGYVVDRTVEAMVATGAERVLVDAGGDLGSGGPRVGDDPWAVGVQDPGETSRQVGRVLLAGEAAATSGDYLQHFTPDRRHHHILDPRTGRSPQELSSVTVVAGTAMDADALSSALMVMGSQAGFRLLADLPDAEALFITKGGRRLASAGWGLRS